MSFAPPKIRVAHGIPLSDRWLNIHCAYVIKRMNKNQTFIGATNDLEYELARVSAEIQNVDAPKRMGGKMEPILAITGFTHATETKTFAKECEKNFKWGRYDRSWHSKIKPKVDQIIPNFRLIGKVWGKTPKHSRGPKGGYGLESEGKIPPPPPSFKKMTLTSGVLRRVWTIRETFRHDDPGADEKFYQHCSDYQDWYKKLCARLAKRQRKLHRQELKRVYINTLGAAPMPFLTLGEYKIDNSAEELINDMGLINDFSSEPWKKGIKYADRDQLDEWSESYTAGHYDLQQRINDFDKKLKQLNNRPTTLPNLNPPRVWRKERNWIVHWSPKIMKNEELFKLLTKDWDFLELRNNKKSEIKHKELVYDWRPSTQRSPKWKRTPGLLEPLPQRKDILAVPRRKLWRYVSREGDYYSHSEDESDDDEDFDTEDNFSRSRDNINLSNPGSSSGFSSGRNSLSVSYQGPHRSSIRGRHNNDSDDDD
ncbi:4401_t:CDS:2 [Ambispora gerdemannii]|uniref:4401_t:CDS:1 n=1 Tax=Ambispora gerdemannii TaxID=144530 RepID=A0A9N9AIK9_9GLOM|nr:4401_t:CDS:2 [Ambispora gerdemannii]